MAAGRTAPKRSLTARALSASSYTKITTPQAKASDQLEKPQNHLSKLLGADRPAESHTRRSGTERRAEVTHRVLNMQRTNNLHQSWRQSCRQQLVILGEEELLLIRRKLNLGQLLVLIRLRIRISRPRLSQKPKMRLLKETLRSELAARH